MVVNTSGPIRPGLTGFVPKRAYSKGPSSLTYIGLPRIAWAGLPINTMKFENSTNQSKPISGLNCIALRGGGWVCLEFDCPEHLYYLRLAVNRI